MKSTVRILSHLCYKSRFCLLQIISSLCSLTCLVLFCLGLSHILAVGGKSARVNLLWNKMKCGQVCTATRKCMQLFSGGNFKIRKEIDQILKY